MNLAKTLMQSAEKYGDKPAVVFEGRSYSFGEIDEHVRRHAIVLKKMGVAKGDRIAIQLPKCMEFIFFHLAALSMGAVSLPLNPAYTADEIVYFLSDSGCSLFFTDTARLTRLQEKIGSVPGVRTVLIDDTGAGGYAAVEENEANGSEDPRNYPTQGDDVAVICYTSGTTGRPKGAMISHRNLVSNMKALKTAWEWTDRDVLLHVLPLFHVHGLMVALHGGLNAGSTIIMHESFDPKRTWNSIGESRCTMLMGVPTIYHRLMNAWPTAKTDLDSMRVFISGSAPLMPDLFYRFEEATGFHILERYGMTETQMIASNPIDHRQRVPKSVGYPLPGIEVRIISTSGNAVSTGEVGEVCIRGENVFKGYWQMPDKTGESFLGGWFRSGDLGYEDPSDNMRLYLVGRAKELIITGGYNVYPREIENVLESHERVSEAAVVGLPDEDFGERVTAFVVLSAGNENPLTDELISYCKRHLASYKCPKAIVPIQKLPRNAMGKVEKHVLQDIFRKEAGGSDA